MQNDSISPTQTAFAEHVNGTLPKLIRKQRCKVLSVGLGVHSISATEKYEKKHQNAPNTSQVRMPHLSPRMVMSHQCT